LGNSRVHCPILPRAPNNYTDAHVHAHFIESLILERKICPLLLVDVPPGRSGAGLCDLRAEEYVPTIKPERFARHEKFFCAEVLQWAERELGASDQRRDRAIYGCSNGACFALEMGLRHPDLFGHVIAFSLAGARNLKLPAAAPEPLRYYFAAGSWEPIFRDMTVDVSTRLKRQHVAASFTERVGGHDEAWRREEFVHAVQDVFAAHRD
jgi:enterochelin esterase-like enzyme